MSKLMKILLLNPNIDAGHKIAKSLTREKIDLLFPADTDEAWQLLQFHSGSIDLAMIHREGPKKKQDEIGLNLIERIKTSSEWVDLPIILTTDKWTDEKCAEHQQGPMGVNAYLRTPFSDEQVLELITAILGDYSADNNSPSFSSDVDSQHGSGAIIEDVDSIFSTPEIANSSITISLDLFDDSEGVELPQGAPQLPIQETAELESSLLSEEEINVVQETPEDVALSLEQPSSVDLQPPPDTATGSMESDSGIEFSNSIELSASPESSGPIEMMSLTGESSYSSGPGLEISLPPDEDSLSSEAPALGESPPSFEGGEDSSSIDLSIEMPTEAPSELLSELSSELPLELPSELPSELPLTPPPLPDSEPLEFTVETSSEFNEPEHTVDSAESSGGDQEVEQEMPYLFSGAQRHPSTGSTSLQMNSAMLFAEPVGDAVVPGGAAHSPDLETLKKYLLLREQDVAVLSNQLKSSKEQIAIFGQSLREERAKNAELTHVSHEQKQKIDHFEKEKQGEMESLHIEMNELRFQLKAKTDKARILETQMREVSEEMERLKERVRIDIRKIRVREKELENRIEIMKKDSEALLGARENKIIELKRKLDLLEFNMDLLQDQYTREKEHSVVLKERLAKAAQVVRVAGGLLDSNKGAEGKNSGAPISTEGSTGEE